MICLRVDFLAGKFHANPWDQGANGEETEWPPSPWRILRAIVAGWERSGLSDHDALLRVLDVLAEPPSFDLPIASAGHTRHCVSLGTMRKGEPKGTLMLDSFVALERGREHGTHAFVIWPHGALEAGERCLLERCCSAIRDFGRVESWCEVSLVDEISSAPGRYRVDLASRDSASGPTVRRLGVGSSLRGAGLLRSLRELSGDSRRARRAMPQGAAWVEYRLPLDFGWASEQALQRDVRQTVFPPTVLRFAIDAEDGVLPPITDAVTVAEKMRQAAIKRYSAATGAPVSRRLAGKNEDGGERRGHDHPFFLPLDLQDRGVVDGLDVWLPDGCTHDEFRALTSIAEIWDNVILEGTFPVTYLGQVERTTGTHWTTVTPVILDRFPKRRGPGGSVAVDAPEEQLQRALERRGLPAASIEIWTPHRTIPHRLGGQTHLDAFRRARIGERTAYPVIGATMSFDQPVVGPIVLGRLAHFGLGRFASNP
jgi:CRISPR-associated protein Csb2